MENIAYWNVVEGAKNDGDKAANMLVYIIAHKNAEAKEASWKAFGADPEWQKVRTESEKDGKILAEPPRAILMTETDFSKFDWPKNGSSQDKAKLYELRQYNDGPARVPFTVERFGFGETKLFTDAGMETIKFWKAQDDSAFIYLLAHKDRDAAKESWSKFMEASKASCKSTTKKKVDRLKMQPRERHGSTIPRSYRLFASQIAAQHLKFYFNKFALKLLPDASD